MYKKKWRVTCNVQCQHHMIWFYLLLHLHELSLENSLIRNCKLGCDMLLFNFQKWTADIVIYKMFLFHLGLIDPCQRSALTSIQYSHQICTYSQWGKGVLWFHQSHRTHVIVTSYKLQVSKAKHHMAPLGVFIDWFTKSMNHGSWSNHESWIMNVKPSKADPLIANSSVECWVADHYETHSYCKGHAKDGFQN